MPHEQEYSNRFHKTKRFFTWSADGSVACRCAGVFGTAVRAEVSEFMAGHAHLLDDAGRQRLVRHGFLPEREVMTGIGKVPVQVPRVRDRGFTSSASRRGISARHLLRLWDQTPMDCPP